MDDAVSYLGHCTCAINRKPKDTQEMARLTDENISLSSANCQQAIMWANSLERLLNAEIEVNKWVQRTFSQSEFLWFGLSEHFSPAQLLDVLVPLVGAFNHQLLVRLVCSLSVINLFNSLVKWIMPAQRPYWWQRESFGHLSENATVLEQYELSCETTAGFPSAHTMAFTAFTNLGSAFLLTHFTQNVHMDEDQQRLCRCVTYLSIVLMSFSRIYLASSFIHQCFIGALFTFHLLHLFDQKSAFFYTMSRQHAVFVVVCWGIFAVGAYFGMLMLNADPHWSVRMAFKWCVDPSFLRHEASPIFVLARDFGYLLGVAFSSPLYRRYGTRTSQGKRILFLICLEALNFYARKSTPKQSGRFAFIGYEFGRNALHSYALLSITSKLL